MNELFSCLTGQQLNHHSNKDMLTVNSNASIEMQLRSRRKAAKMLVVVVIVFAVCYFPVHLVNILRYWSDKPIATAITKFNLLLSSYYPSCHGSGTIFFFPSYPTARPTLRNCFFFFLLLHSFRYTVKLPQNDYTVAAALISHWLCYFNSAINPVIYNFMSGKWSLYI